MSGRLADRRERRRQRRLFWGLAALLVAYGALVGDHRPHHLLLLKWEERRTEERIDELAARQAELEATRRRLEEDPFALETLAREKGMIRKGDLVYRIVPVPSDVRLAAAESLARNAARQDSLAAAARAGASGTR